MRHPQRVPSPSAAPTIMGYTYLAQHAASDEWVALTTEQRLRHTWIAGATGYGKSTLLEHMIAQDLAAGDGVIVIDPNGSLAERTLTLVPPSRINHTCYFSPGDLDRPVAWNLLDNMHPDQRGVTVEGIVGALREIWPDSWGPRMENLLRHTLLALTEMPSASLLMVRQFLVDESYRRRALAHVKDPFVRRFFRDEYDNKHEDDRDTIRSPILNKVGAITSTPYLRNILCQPTSTLSFKHLIDNRQVLIANLAQGRIGDWTAHLAGALLITQLRAAGMARAQLPLNELAKAPLFHLFIDEAQWFGVQSLASIIEGLRKFRGSLTLANQNAAQLPEKLLATLVGTTQTVVSFRVGPDDAELLARRMRIDPGGLTQMPIGMACFDGQMARVPPPIGFPDADRIGKHVETLKGQSARRYGRPRTDVEAKLTKVIASAKPAKSGRPSPYKRR